MTCHIQSLIIFHGVSSICEILINIESVGPFFLMNAALENLGLLQKKYLTKVLRNRGGQHAYNII